VKRIDMAPDGMTDMAGRIEQLPSTEPGVYRYPPIPAAMNAARISIDQPRRTPANNGGAQRIRFRCATRPWVEPGRFGDERLHETFFRGSRRKQVLPTKWQSLQDYEFRLVQNEAKKGDAIVAVRLVNKRTGKPVSDAVIAAKRSCSSTRERDVLNLAPFSWAGAGPAMSRSATA
jgi:hypothetical protein